MPQPPKDGELAVSPRYTNLNRSRPAPFGISRTVLADEPRRCAEHAAWKLTTEPPIQIRQAGTICGSG